MSVVLPAAALDVKPADNPQWVADCLRWRGRVLVGQHGHWCADWDGLPVDETCPEWPCCDIDEEAARRESSPED